jgi:hypothetical protein
MKALVFLTSSIWEEKHIQTRDTQKKDPEFFAFYIKNFGEILWISSF